MKKNAKQKPAMGVAKTPAAPSASISVASSKVPIDLLRKYSSPKPTKQPNTKVPARLSNAKLRELAKKHKPPQSWFDNDEAGLY